MFYKTFICLIFFFSVLLNQSCSQHQKGEKETRAYTNALIHESSPYLLQHAHNPVNWYPWGEEALNKAKQENKLLIISIGYAACHWCHVMERESFEDSAVAAVMNKHFVSVKVDREERPDIDQIYMNAAQLMNGRGGWPLNSIALPDGRPVFVGTYFPKQDWLHVLEQLARMYQSRPERLKDIARRVANGIRSSEVVTLEQKEVTFSAKELDKYFDQVKDQLDYAKGGMKGTTKFPMPVNQQFLMQYFYYTGNIDARKAFIATLDNMALGGIYDHLGGGFARYSTDENWLIPHFEKMLYDNAQLVSLYAKAYQLSKNPFYKKVVYETLDFVKREMTSGEGAFYSSLDADSQDEEGKYYVWTGDEIDQALGKEADLFKDYYHVSDKGNWEEGKNVLHMTLSDTAFAKKHNLGLKVLEEKIKQSRQKLLEVRSQRIKPALDDKILTSWNALMLNAYVDAYRIFSEKSFLEAALKNANFLKEKVMDNRSHLTRSYKDGKATVDGFLDDYSFVIVAFINLYQATFNEEWLYLAQDLLEYTLDHFMDNKTQMFFYTSDVHPDLIARKKEIADNVIPASNSEMAKNLFLLGTYFSREDYVKQAHQMLANVRNNVKRYPFYHANWAALMHYFVYEPYEVAIVGHDYGKKRQELDQHYLPDVILLGGSHEGTLELLENKLVKGKTTLYVCQNKVCQLPVTEVDKAIAQIK